jgi:putative flippase GtrA
MISRQYLWFCINGGILGIVSLGLQVLIYRGMDVNTGFAYGVATALTYAPLVLINFVIQRRWIFKKNGQFWRFVLANLSIMVLVSLFAPLCRLLIASLAGAEWGDKGGFALAALAMSVPSYFAKRLLVFKNDSHV